MSVLKRVFKLGSFKKFIKRSFFVIFIVASLFIVWMLSLIHSYPTNYDKRNVITETSNFAYSDWVNFMPYIKTSQSSYVIKLDTGTYVYMPKYIYDELLDIELFEKNEKGQIITVEYDIDLGYTYQLNNGTTITAHKLISLKRSEHEYISRDDYIIQTEIVRQEYAVLFLIAIVTIAVVYLALAFWAEPLYDIKRVINHRKNVKIKRAKKGARKPGDVSVSSSKTTE